MEIQDLLLRRRQASAALSEEVARFRSLSAERDELQQDLEDKARAKECALVATSGDAADVEAVEQAVRETRKELRQLRLRLAETEARLEWCRDMAQTYLRAIELESQPQRELAEGLAEVANKTEAVLRVIAEATLQGKKLKPADIQRRLEDDLLISMSSGHLYNVLNRLVASNRVQKDKGMYFADTNEEPASTPETVN